MPETPSHNINNHLDRLHRRAKQNQMQVTPSATPTPMMDMSGRGSGMSDMTAIARTPTGNPNGHVPNHAQMPTGHHGSGRRASDPVRMLDRNFGVEGQMSRHARSGSFGPVSAAQPRVPMHGQRIRGMSGDTYFQQQQQQNSGAQQMVRKFHISHILQRIPCDIRNSRVFFQLRKFSCVASLKFNTKDKENVYNF